MRYHGAKCHRCGGLAMTDTDGNGKLRDICPVCDWGWTPASYAPSPPDKPVVAGRGAGGGRKVGVYNLGSFKCADCRRVVTRRSATHKRCDACAPKYNRKRDIERGAAVTARRRQRKAAQVGRMKSLRAHYLQRPSRFAMACA